MPRSTSTVLISAATAIFAASGCKKVEPAPKALDRLFPYFFTEIDNGTNEDLAFGIRELDRMVEKEEVEDLLDGSITKLSRSDLAVIDMDDRDPSGAFGVFMLNRVSCSFGQLEEILYYKNQDELYDGVYDRYNRTFTSDKQAYIDRDTFELTWDVDYDATIVGTSYTSKVKGKLRRVPDLGKEETPYGAFLVARAYIPQPADFGSSSSKSLTQDYQIEMYYKVSSSEVLHAYGIWREANFGGSLTSENEGTQRLLLNSLEDWDKDTEKLCEEERP